MSPSALWKSSAERFFRSFPEKSSQVPQWRSAGHRERLYGEHHVRPYSSVPSQKRSAHWCFLGHQEIRLLDGQKPDRQQVSGRNPSDFPLRRRNPRPADLPRYPVRSRRSGSCHHRHRAQAHPAHHRAVRGEGREDRDRRFHRFWRNGSRRQGNRTPDAGDRPQGQHAHHGPQLHGDVQFGGQPEREHHRPCPRPHEPRAAERQLRHRSEFQRQKARHGLQLLGHHRQPDGCPLQ